jgi:hypothetical protein
MSTMFGPLEKANAKHRITHSKEKSKITYDRRSFGQFVLVSGHHLGEVTNFFVLKKGNYLQTFMIS